MRRSLIWMSFLYLSFFTTTEAVFAYQVRFEASVQSPLPGEAVQGVVQVIGTTDIRNFEVYELAFAFEGDPTESWFVLAESTEAIERDVLGEWDTTTLTDGEYKLRLIVTLDGDEPQEILVEGLRVRNYTPIETSTPAPTIPAAPGATLTFTASPLPPTVTPLAPNPAEFSTAEIQASLLRGMVIAAVLLGSVGLYILTRRSLRE
ncbi:MAG: hypothetical protein HND51_19450 [Chloroflexi bacterium]|nr:hypothetical protein [Chloroflexota bacterium]